MTIEHEVKIEEKSDERWHADKGDITVTIGSAGLLFAGHFLGGVYTIFAAALALTELAVLRSKAKNAARSKSQGSPS